MPIKLPKSFPRRKSSGNALEDLDLQQPDKPSSPEQFRLLSREEVSKIAAEKRQSEIEKPKKGILSGSRPFSSPAQKARQHSFDDDSNASNRGSNGSSAGNSALSRIYDTSSLSARYSSSSTLPSSAEADHNTSESFTKDITHKPQTDSRTFSIRNAARTFTLGTRAPRQSVSSGTRLDHIPGEEKIPAIPARTTRERTMTASTYASTATPPKIEPKLGLNSDFGSDFTEDLFSSIGKRHSLEQAKGAGKSPAVMRSESEPILSLPGPQKAFGTSRPNYLPAPIRIDRSLDIEAPLTGDSGGSREALMARNAMSPASERFGYPSYSEKVGTPVRQQSSPEDRDAKMVRESYQAHRTSMLAMPKVESKQTGESTASDYSMQTPSTSSANSSVRIGAPQDIPPHSYGGADSSHASDESTNQMTPRARPSQPSKDQSVEEDESLFDHPRSAVITASPSHSGQPMIKRVMNQDEFNAYRKQQALDGGSNDDEDISNDDDSGDDYDETEATRHREATKLRRKQEEKMAVYRQQMKKTTGDNTVLFPAKPRVSSVPNPYGGHQAGDSPDDSSEDEDVPLGILKEHGFPHKARPPNKLPNATSSILLRPGSTVGYSSVGQAGQLPPRPNSASGSVSGFPRTKDLPVFARHLPPDPYYGASLVNQANREPLRFGLDDTVSAPRDTMMMNRPGGLVGIIAEEERAKAARRASPNAQPGFGGQMGTQNSFLGPQQQQQMPMPMPMPPQSMATAPLPGLHQPMDNQALYQLLIQSQIQNQQYMQQLMAMQAQQMQSSSMMHLPLQPPQQMNGLAPPTLGQQPISMPLPGNPPYPQQRAMSMVGQPPWGGQQLQQNYPGSIRNSVAPGLGGYAPSLAPSERSNIGMASRYRPVTLHGGAEDIPSVTSQNGHHNASLNGSQTSLTVPGKIRVVEKPKNYTNATPRQTEDDEDGGWGDLRNRKSKWSRGKKANSEPSLKDLLKGL